MILSIVVSVRMSWKLPLCPVETIPEGSKLEMSSSADTRISGEGAQPTFPASADIPLQPMEVPSAAEMHQQPMGDPVLEQLDAQGGCEPRRRGVHAGAGL